MNKILSVAICALCILILSACAIFFDPNDPQKDGQYVSVINSLTWTNPLTGKRDGLRSSWPLKKLQGHEEYFPLAQIRDCPPLIAVCFWGVMKAQRKITSFAYAPGGISLDLALAVELDRRQEVHQPNFDAAMTIPSDVAALRASMKIQRSLNLQYGKVARIDLDYGVRFETCALRYDAAGRALDVCDIAYI